MPDHHTTIRLMNTDFPVTVTWDVCGVDDGQPEYEIEAVVSDLLGDVTHLVLNSLQGYTFAERVRDHGWQDPIRTAMFGLPYSYDPSDSRLRVPGLPHDRTVRPHWGATPLRVVQHEPARTAICTFSALRQKICDEIDELPEMPDRLQAYYDWLASD